MEESYGKEKGHERNCNTCVAREQLLPSLFFLAHGARRRFSLLDAGEITGSSESTDRHVTSSHAPSSSCLLDRQESWQPFLCFPSFNHFTRDSLATPHRLLALIIVLLIPASVLMLLVFWVALVSLRRWKLCSPVAGDRRRARPLQVQVSSPRETLAGDLAMGGW